MTTQIQITQNTAPSKYYPLNETSQQWQDWSVDKISLQTWYLVPVGLIGLVASTALRLIEGTFMLLANVCLAIKYLFVAPTNYPAMQNAAPVIQIPANVSPVLLPVLSQPLPPAPPQIAAPPQLNPRPVNPTLSNPQLVARVEMPSSPPILPHSFNSGFSNPQPAPSIPILPVREEAPDQQRGCTTSRIKKQATTQIESIKQNPRPVISLTAGLVATGACFAFPILVPIAAGAAATKLVLDRLNRENNA